MTKRAGRVLFVDDEPNLLNGFKRRFSRRYDVAVAPGGQEALRIIESSEPFAVIVSDMKMPGLSGTEFLARARVCSPESVRIMLTGVNDLSVAMGAVNQGNIFRFLTKPCSSDDLAQALEAAFDQHRLVVSERELLEETLQGAIHVMGDVLALANPIAFGRASRIKRYVRGLVKAISATPNGGTEGGSKPGSDSGDDLWQYELAATLSQIGCVSLPPDLIERLYGGQELTDEESHVFSAHPLAGRDLITRIPRLADVAEMIAYQEKRYDGTGVPADELKGSAIPLGGRILKIVLDYDLIVAHGEQPQQALTVMRERRGYYDTDILKSFENLVGLEAQYVPKRLPTRDLIPGMILAEDVFSLGGRLLIAKGHELNRSILRHLDKFANNEGVREPTLVLVRSTQSHPLNATAEPSPTPA